MSNCLKRRERIKQRLRRGREARQDFVSSHIAKAVAFQIRAMRNRAGWSQAELARRCGTSQNAISRLESPDYGKPSITTLKKIAGVFDVALIVRYAKFSELIDWVVSLTEESVLVPIFGQEQHLSWAGELALELPTGDQPVKQWRIAMPIKDAQNYLDLTTREGQSSHVLIPKQPRINPPHHVMDGTSTARELTVATVR